MSTKASDQTVWQLCQARGYLLLTGNRTTKDKEKSLEFSIRRLLTSYSLPVLTIGNLKRVSADPNYCRACAERLIEIVDNCTDIVGSYVYIFPDNCHDKHWTTPADQSKHCQP